MVEGDPNTNVSTSSAHELQPEARSDMVGVEGQPEWVMLWNLIKETIAATSNIFELIQTRWVLELISIQAENDHSPGDTEGHSGPNHCCISPSTAF